MRVLIVNTLYPPAQVGGAERSGSSWLEWSTPVVLSRTLVTWPSDLPLEIGPLPRSTMV